MAAYWGIAAHSAYDMFSWYTYLSVISKLVFPTPRFMEWDYLSDCAIPDHCLIVPFYWVYWLGNSLKIYYTS